jgi:hypothetical protein
MDLINAPGDDMELNLRVIPKSLPQITDIHLGARALIAPVRGDKHNL